MKIAAIVAARMTSTRLPGKILKELAGKPALAQLIGRLKRSKYLQDIMIATTINREDDQVVATAEQEKVAWYRGSELDVLARTVEAAESVNADYIVQIKYENEESIFQEENYKTKQEFINKIRRNGKYNNDIVLLSITKITNYI